MNILQSTKNLVQEKLYMGVAQRLRRLDDGTEIRLHQLTDDIDIIKSVGIQRPQDSFETYYLLWVATRRDNVVCAYSEQDEKDTQQTQS